MTKKAFGWLFVLVLIVASSFRLPELGRRPMHHDEANQAVKFGLLLEAGQYRYDPTDHHGPSLYYLSWPVARLLGGKTLASQSESTIRAVPVLFGLGTVLLLLLFLPALGHTALLLSGLGLALSPAMAYFSRFYIQESLLVFFLAGFLGSVWRWARRPSAGWAVSTGFFAGMMYATKETAVVLFVSTAAALSLTFLTKRKGMDEPGYPVSVGLFDSGKKKEKAIGSRHWFHVVLALGVALFVSVLLFSSFFKHPQGICDSVLSFKVYYVRAGETTFHAQPWFSYFKLLAFFKTKGGHLWSEAFLLFLALVGGGISFWSRREAPFEPSLLRFLFFYTFLTAAILSFIRYKTPWNVLPFHLGVILLAGAGAAGILKACSRRGARLLALLLLGAGFFHLGWQSCQANFIFPADPQNPYVYAQTSPNYLKLVARVEEIASTCAEGKRMLVKVVASPYETWPLPWSLRKFERVGYWERAAEVELSDRPPVIIASAEQAVELSPAIHTLYISEYYELRPNVLLVLFVRSDIWQAYLRQREGR